LSFFLYNNYKTQKIYDCLNIVTPYLGFLSAAEVGFFPGINSYSTKKKKLFSYFSGVFDYNLLNNNFIVYQGFFKSSTFLFTKANLIFPTSSFTERNSTYLNVEGRLRQSKKVVIPFKFLFSE